jgi:predicted transcriptional regulator of viral defense system
LKKQNKKLAGVFSAKEALVNGMTRQELSRLVAQGEVERLARGVYAFADASHSSNMEIEILARKGVDFVVTLESALQIHGFPNATPHAVWIAMKRGARRPKVDFPLEVVRVDERSHRHGVEERVIDGASVCVYSAAKTVADLFKFRNRVGLEIAIAALKDGLREKRFSADELMRAADVDRVRRIVTPYVEGYFG